MSSEEADDLGASLDRIHDDPEAAVAAMRALAPDEGTAGETAAIFRALANGDRVRLLSVLREGERCGCELRAALDAPQSTVSTHLRRLREVGLVTSRREGRWRYYRVADAGAFDLLDLAVAVAGVET